MRQSEIVIGETYLFRATDSPERQYLIGEPFTVVSKKAVFRKFGRNGTRKVNRFFNEDGVAARPEELGELPERENPCPDCPTGEFEHIGTSPSRNESIMHYECNKCGKTASFP